MYLPKITEKLITNERILCDVVVVAIVFDTARFENRRCQLFDIILLVVDTIILSRTN